MSFSGCKSFTTVMVISIISIGMSAQLSGCASDSYASKGAKQGAMQGAAAGAVGGLVTALVPVIGYEPSAAIAKEALKTGGSVYELVLEKGLLTQEQLDEMLKPENMTDPREIPTN